MLSDAWLNMGGGWDGHEVINVDDDVPRAALERNNSQTSLPSFLQDTPTDMGATDEAVALEPTMDTGVHRYP